MEIQKLQDSIENCQVTSEIDGVVKSINNGNQDSYSSSGDSQAFMSIIAMGDFRIKCKVNEQNIASVTPGQAVIVHSRVDDSVTWKGTMGAVDKENRATIPIMAIISAAVTDPPSPIPIRSISNWILLRG